MQSDNTLFRDILRVCLARYPDWVNYSELSWELRERDPSDLRRHVLLLKDQSFVEVKEETIDGSEGIRVQVDWVRLLSPAVAEQFLNAQQERKRPIGFRPPRVSEAESAMPARDEIPERGTLEPETPPDLTQSISSEITAAARPLAASIADLASSIFVQAHNVKYAVCGDEAHVKHDIGFAGLSAGVVLSNSEALNQAVHQLVEELRQDPRIAAELQVRLNASSGTVAEEFPSNIPSDDELRALNKRATRNAADFLNREGGSHASFLADFDRLVALRNKLADEASNTEDLSRLAAILEAQSEAIVLYSLLSCALRHYEEKIRDSGFDVHDPNQVGTESASKT